MGRRRMLLFALLIYITLDLSLAAMPGAFVFEPDDSVESLLRVRAAVDVVMVPALAADVSALEPAVEGHDRRPATAQPERAEALGLRHRPRAVLDPASSSEDPH